MSGGIAAQHEAGGIKGPQKLLPSVAMPLGPFASHPPTLSLFTIRPWGFPVPNTMPITGFS